MPSEPDAADPDAILLLFILPNGTRLERRFRRSDKLKVCPIIQKKYVLSMSKLMLHISFHRIYIHTYFVTHNHQINLRLRPISQNEHSKPNRPKFKSTQPALTTVKFYTFMIWMLKLNCGLWMNETILRASLWKKYPICTVFTMFDFYPIVKQMK